ncbi:hypothetical protein T439DRAFT_322335 [Meredithblackwellia eburnea MCA 4105]
MGYTAECQCGKASFEFSDIQATYICHCLECRAQSASAFGCSAIVPLPSPTPNPQLNFPFCYLPETIKDEVSVYVRDTDSGGRLHCCFCRGCGSRLVHFREGGKTMSVKGGTIREFDWKSAWKGNHIWTKSAVVDIPVGAKTWPGEPDD